MSGECLVRQETDSGILGAGFYRLERWAPEALPGEMAALPSPSLIEARVKGELIEPGRQLMRLGFMKICCQANFLMDLTGDGPADADAAGTGEPETARRLGRDLLTRHAANLSVSQFSLDPLLPGDCWLELHRRFIGHALESERILKFFCGDSFICFSLFPDRVFIEQLSVLTPRQGHGSALVARAARWGRAMGLPLLEVCTECDNEAAFHFYLNQGFRPAAFFNVFHFHKGRVAPPV